jgi:hypothetical protein
VKKLVLFDVPIWDLGDMAKQSNQLTVWAIGAAVRAGSGGGVSRPDQGPSSMGLTPDIGLRGILLGVQ